MASDTNLPRDSISHRICVLDNLVKGQTETEQIYTSLVTREGLLDALLTLHEECSHDNLMKNKHVNAFVKKYDETISELKKLRIKVSDFEVKDVIGRGHFGEVQVVRDKVTSTVYAMKILRKHETLSQQEISFYEEERDIMAKATSPWITRLHFAFQDAQNLYLVMEFHAGGDLLSLLSRHDDIFEEDMARFYLAEITISIHSLHCMGYVHRDVKPENILIDYHGHVKLADFGSAAKLSPDMLVSSRMPVGTPDYVSPELLTSMNNHRTVNNYGIEVDWWSLGVCMYEMLLGHTPFTDEGGSMVVTYSNIMNFKRCLKFQDDHHLSSAAVDLIKGLLTEKERRFGYNDLLSHKFFAKINWDILREETPPFIPHLSSLDDTSNFEELERVKYQPMFNDYQGNRDFTGKDLPFVGFTYTRKDLRSLATESDQRVLETSTDSSVSTDTVYHSVSAAVSKPSTNNLEVTLTVKTAEIQSLRDKYRRLEETECNLRSQLEKAKLESSEKDDELSRLQIVKESLEHDLHQYVSKSEGLAHQLEAANEDKQHLEYEAEQLVLQIQDMTREAQDIEHEILRSEIEELQEVVTQLEGEKKNLLSKISSRDKQLNLFRQQLTASQETIAKLQTKLDKERRKSRDSQRRDLTILETREETWRSQMEDRNSEIMELNKKIQEMEDLIEAFEMQERDFMEREQQLLQKTQGCGHIDKVELRVWLSTCPLNESMDSEMRTKKIKELELRARKHSVEYKEWEDREENLRSTIEKLQADIESHRQQMKLTSQSKDNMTKQVQVYQEEVLELRQKMKDLQENVKMCMEDEEEKAKQNSSSEQRVKELQIEIDLLRDEKRQLQKDIYQYKQTVDDKNFKIAEYERTISRQTGKLERLERQLSETKERELELRVRNQEQADNRIKYANERVTELRKEKQELEKKLEETKNELNTLNLRSTLFDNQKSDLAQIREEKERISAELVEVKNNLDKCKEEKFDLSQNVRKVSDERDQLDRSLHRSKDEIEDLNKRLKDAESQSKILVNIETEKEILQERVKDLENQTKKLDELEQLRRERDSLSIKVQSLEKELEEQKIISAKRWNKIEDAEDLRQENGFLETKVKSQQNKIEKLEVKVKDLEDNLKSAKEFEGRFHKAMEDVDRIRLEKKSVEVRMRELQLENEQKLRAYTGTKKDSKDLEDKLSKEREKHDQMMSELRKELHDANLALSEARSLLAASERQERSMRDRYDAEIRELQLKLHKAESIVDLEQEIKLLKSKNEKSTRQFKEMEEKVHSLQKEKSALCMEKQMANDQLIQKEHQCQLEIQKVDKLQHICRELENQIKDLEALTEEQERQQGEWDKIRKTFEEAVNEREDEIDGTTHRLQALEQAKHSANEKAQSMKHQVQSLKALHKSEIESLNHHLWEVKRSDQKRESQINDLEEQISKLKLVNDSQRRNLEAHVEEKTKLKEEISSIMTDNQDLRSKNLKLKHNLDEAMDKFELIFGEKVNLENFAEALQGLHFLEKYKFESTIGQQMKLIDYLHALYDDNNGKKKKSSSKLFGSAKGKDTTSPGAGLIQPLEDLQMSLEQERKRNSKLLEQNEKLRQENFSQANELLKLKGPMMEKVENTPEVKKAVEALVRSPSINSSNLLTPSVKRSASVYSNTVPAPKRMHHNIPHRFVTGLNTRATKCAVCLGSVPFVKMASKCQECHMVCHPKCITSVPATCGLPTEYVQQFTSFMSNPDKCLTSKRLSPLMVDDNVHIQGWLKVPKSGKQMWERKWASLENNILLLYHTDTDPSPYDTFNLNPPETDVTIHSAISTAELPSTAVTDLGHVMKLEHEPLTTCWPGRVLFLMAVTFAEKQRWVASFEAAVKKLQKVDPIRRQRVHTTNLLELEGDNRLDLNCVVVFSKQQLMIGTDEGLFMLNTQTGKQQLVKLTGFPSVHQIEHVGALGMYIMIIGKERHVVKVDKKTVKIKLEQATKNQTPHIHHDPINGIVGCSLMEVKRSQERENVYIFVGMADRVQILKYNAQLREFCVRKEFMTTEPCSCMCITNDFVLIGTNKFYRIDFDHPSMTEFVDKKDNSLAFAVYGAVIHKSFPLGVIKVSPEGLPLEFLLCYHEFGVYVDKKGRRSRPADLKWSCLPLSFAYSEPFLYITYFNSVQAITVPADKSETRGKQTLLDIHCPRYLGKAVTMGGVYVSASSGHGIDLLCLRGDDGFTPGYDDRKEEKENKYSLAANKGRTGGRFVSPKRGTTPGSSHMRRNLSLTSLDSNYSDYSTGTFSSTDSQTTYGSNV